MRILFPYLARWHSANRSRYHHLLSALAGRGHAVTVLQPPPWPGAEETNFIEMPGPDIPGVRIEELRLPAAIWNARLPLEKVTKKGLAAVSARGEVLRRCRDEAVDVLLLYHIAHSPLVRATAGCVVFDLADDLLAMLAEEVSPLFGALAYPVAAGLLRRLIASADLVTTPSSVLVERAGGRATVISNGADLSAITAADPGRIRAAHRPPIIGYVGAFEYFVDFELILEVAARLPEATVLMVGGGRRLSHVRQQVRDRGLRNVDLPGPVRYADALDYMAAFDVALLPFRPGPVSDASSPLKLLEYLALGRPVFATPMTEVRRIAGPWIQEGQTAESCVAFVRAVTAGAADVRGRAAAGRAAVREHYTWEKVAAAFEAHLGHAQMR